MNGGVIRSTYASWGLGEDLPKKEKSPKISKVETRCRDRIMWTMWTEFCPGILITRSKPNAVVGALSRCTIYKNPYTNRPLVSDTLELET